MRLSRSSRLMSLWSEDDEHLVPFHLRPGLHFTDVRHVVLEPFENACTQLTVRHLTATKPDRRFHFVAVAQPLMCTLRPVFVIVVVGARTKLHFVNCDRGLLLLRFVCLLLGFVLELAKVDNPANRWIGIRGNSGGPGRSEEQTSEL